MPEPAAPQDATPTLEQLAERKDAAWRAAWAAMGAWLDARPERRPGKVQREVDAACDAYLAAATTWRAAHARELTDK